MSIQIPPEKIPDLDYSWKMRTELTILERMIMSEENFKLLRKTVKEQVDTFNLVNSKTEINYYSLGNREIIND